MPPGRTDSRTEAPTASHGIASTYAAWVVENCSKWCPEPGSNRHSRNGRRILSPLRLPVPPSGQNQEMDFIPLERRRSKGTGSTMPERSGGNSIINVDRRELPAPRTVRLLDPIGQGVDRRHSLP